MRLYGGPQGPGGRDSAAEGRVTSESPTIDASRPAETPRKVAGSTMPAPGGMPAELKKTLVESPLLPLVIESASAAPNAVSSIDYPIALTYTTADEKRQLSGGHLYERDGELVIVADFERLGGGLLARSREGTALLDIPPGSLKPGAYHVTLVGEQGLSHVDAARPLAHPP